MGRRINTVGYQAGGGSTVDGYFDKVIKYVPSDVIAAWTAISGLFASQSGAGGRQAATANVNATAASTVGGGASDNTVLWIAFIIGVVFTALWTWKQTSQPNKPPAVRQIVVATVAFIIWVFALGPPFSALDFYNSKISAAVLIGSTLLLGLIPADSSAPQGGDPPPSN